MELFTFAVSFDGDPVEVLQVEAEDWQEATHKVERHIVAEQAEQLKVSMLKAEGWVEDHIDYEIVPVTRVR